MNTSPRERAPRQEQEQERRRRRDGGVIGRRLGVAESMLDFNRFAYRWLNDEPARIMAKTRQDDWDIVTQDGGALKEDSADLGTAVSQIVGVKPDGSPKRAYLCRKPKTYFDEDQAAKQQTLDDQLAEMRRGNDRDGASQSDYVPKSGIRL